MSPSRRAAVLALVGAAALSVPGPPASASASAPSLPVTVAAVPTPTVTRTAGITTMDGRNSEGWRTGAVLFDSRNRSALRARTTMTIDLAAAIDVPADATAAVLTVTSVAPTTAGWLTVWAADAARPTASTLNFAPGTPTPNLAVVRMSPDKKVKVYNGSGGSTHVLVSLRGWIRSNQGTTLPGSMTVSEPTRVLDTRLRATPIPAKGYRDVKVVGVGTPAGATSALLDLVAVKPTRAGYLIAHPNDSARPTSTALTYRVGSDRAALTLVKLSATGTVRLWNMSAAPVHVVLDSFAWTAGGTSVTTPLGTSALAPSRVLDTRQTGGPLSAGNLRKATFDLSKKARAAGVPQASSAVLAVTATGATRGGHLYLTPAGLPDDRMSPYQTPSVLNFGPAETVTNTTYVMLPIDQAMTVVANTSGSVHAIVDLVGFVNHSAEVDGRVVEEGSGAPVYPSAVGVALPGPFLYATTPDARFAVPFQQGEGSLNVCAAAMKEPATVSGEDVRYAPACHGPTGSVPITLTLGARTDIGDLSVPRTGSLSGSVVGPTGSPLPGQNVLLQRSDRRFTYVTGSNLDGTWSSPRVPVGDWLVTVRPNGGSNGTAETLDGIPRMRFGDSDIPNLLAAGARTFTVDVGEDTAVGSGQVLTGGGLTTATTDPDGDYSDVTVSIRHSTGYEVRTGRIPGPTMTQLYRPGSYTVCLTEGSATRCTGGGTSHETATPVVVESNVTSKAEITLP